MLSAVPSFVVHRSVAAGFADHVHPDLAAWVPRVRRLLTSGRIGDAGQAWGDTGAGDDGGTFQSAVARASATLVSALMHLSSACVAN